ncbi:MAG TPA: hypothetical protein VJ656_07875 [Pyrinomonadaceae bacterium]|nr:hypothetical protein [Pyrinomonadaceae bacterium]
MNYKPYKTNLALLVFVLCALSVQAQSGRRKTTPPPVAPVPTPTPEPTPTPKKEGEKPELVFLVGTDRNSSHTLLPLGFHTAAQRGCADRLRARSAADVDAPHGDMGRGQAIEKAKKSTNTYVVLLTLQFDTMVSSSNDIQLDFTVFAPATAKVVLTGRSYVNANRAGPVIVGRTGIPAGVMREQWLRDAGEEAADKILKKLNMVVPPTK